MKGFSECSTGLEWVLTFRKLRDRRRQGVGGVGALDFNSPPEPSPYSFNVSLLQPYLAQDCVAGSFIIAANDGQ